MEILLIPVFILFALLAPVIAAALALYGVPLRAAAALRYSGERRERSVTIAWGIVALNVSGSGTGQDLGISILGRRIASHAMPAVVRKEEPEPPVPEDVVGPGTGLEPDELIHIAHRMIAPLTAFGSVLWQQTRFEELRGTVLLGLGNPALTGEVYGYYWASRFALQASRVFIDLEPDFDRAVLALDITIRERLDHPLLVLIAGTNLAICPAVKDILAMTVQRGQGTAGA